MEKKLKNVLTYKGKGIMIQRVSQWPRKSVFYTNMPGQNEMSKLSQVVYVVFRQFTFAGVKKTIALACAHQRIHKAHYHHYHCH